MRSAVPTTIIGREASGKCDVTGKANVEIFIVRIGRGAPKRIAAKSLLETLRLTCSIELDSSDKKTQSPSTERVEVQQTQGH